MTLDPEARKLLAALEADMPAFETLDPVTARRLGRERQQRARIPAVPVERVDDLVVPGPAGPLAVRVYGPDAEPRTPLVVFFHGGGWVVCDLDSHDNLCRRMANATGGTVVSVDYRLAPEHPFPAPLEDAYAATCWAVDHAAELGADAGRVAVAGDSAGGNLAAAVALVARDRGGPRLTFQLLVYPAIAPDFTTPSYDEHPTGFGVSRATMRWFWRHYLGADDGTIHPYASPILAHDLAGLPPALVVTAEHDPLRDEGEAYGHALAAHGVDATVVRYDGGFHGFFSMAHVLGLARRANDEVFATLARGLRPPARS